MKASLIAPGVGGGDGVAAWPCRPARTRCCRAVRRRRVLPVAVAVDVALHERHPDRQRGQRARLVRPERLLDVVAHPHADRDVRIEADEPRVGVVVDGAGLAGERPVERRAFAAVPRSTTPSQQADHDERRVGADALARDRAGSPRAACRRARRPSRRCTAACARPGSGTAEYALVISSSVASDAPERGREVRLQRRLDAEPARVADRPAPASAAPSASRWGCCATARARAGA